MVPETNTTANTITPITGYAYKLRKSTVRSIYISQYE
jgi:hypothetical protein